MIEFLRLILHIIASFFRPKTKLVAEILANSSTCFADRYRSDHNSAIQIAFCLFGSIVGSLPSSARLQFSGQRRSSAGIAQGSSRTGASGHANRLAGRESRPSCDLIGAMSRANHLWGAPHIHGELLKLGFTIAQSTVARYMYRGWPPSQGWRTFLTNHVGIAAIDLFVLPTITFRLLYCLVILRHGRRLWVSFGVTTNPTAEWISRQIIE